MPQENDELFNEFCHAVDVVKKKFGKSEDAAIRFVKQWWPISRYLVGKLEEVEDGKRC